MSLIEVVILGVVEGITEFLPISSTGHLILTGFLLGTIDDPFFKTFEIAIQLGAIAAVLHLYYKRIRQSLDIITLVCVGFLPGALAGLIFYEAARSLLDNPLVVVISLFVGGVVLLGIERIIPQPKFTLENLSLMRAPLIGLFQVLAFIPGVSRSAATIIGGMFFGLSRSAALEFSFLLAIPTMAAATFLDLSSHYHLLTSENIYTLFIGMLVAYVSALYAIRWLLSFVEQNTFFWFGVYRIFVAFTFYFFLF